MPTRYLKPGICDSDLIDRCSTLAECLFYRLLVNVDDFGRIDARPAVIRAKCFPLKENISNKDTEILLNELNTIGLIVLYKISGCIYLQMQKWDNIPRSKESKCPDYTDDCIQLHTDVNNSHTVLPVTVNRNRKPEPEQKQSPEKPPAFILPDWIDSDTWNLWLKTRKKKMIPQQLQAHVDKLDRWRQSGLDYAQSLTDAAIAGYLALQEPKNGKTHRSIHDERADTIAELTGTKRRSSSIEGTATRMD